MTFCQLFSNKRLELVVEEMSEELSTDLTNCKLVNIIEAISRFVGSCLRVCFEVINVCGEAETLIVVRFPLCIVWLLLVAIGIVSELLPFLLVLLLLFIFFLLLLLVFCYLRVVFSFGCGNALTSVLHLHNFTASVR